MGKRGHDVSANDPNESTRPPAPPPRRMASEMTLPSVVGIIGPDVTSALAAKERFVARLRSVDPTLIEAFDEFLLDYTAPR